MYDRQQGELSRRSWECHVRVNNDINNFNNEGTLIVPLFFAILLLFPRDQNISKQSLKTLLVSFMLVVCEHALTQREFRFKQQAWRNHCIEQYVYLSAVLDPFRGEANVKGTGVQTGELLAFTYNRFKVIQRIKIILCYVRDSS